MIFKKNKLALGIATASVTLAAAMVSPQVAAGSKSQHHAEVGSLQSQVNEMAAMMRSMQSEIARLKSEGNSANAGKVQELEQWMASVKAAPVATATKDHAFLVRGGWMSMNQTRGSSTGLAGLSDDVLTSQTDEDAFYYGGAIDFNMNNDLFGMMDGVSFGIELGIEYAELGDRKDSGLDNVITGVADIYTGGTGAAQLDLQQTVTVNQLRVSAAPKIKFMHGSKFRPWIIPMGLDFNIISPPSDAVTVLNTGMQFGAGADYELLPGVVLGVDGRYHWSPDDIDGVDTDGFTAGGYVGFKF
ncbi:MAG: hypothetical protein GQ569_14240 [Methylococcaceae bacterium]|nr:hypothetical protein [Methylococcaceae bacterium]